MKIAIVWFKTDLRLYDNEALVKAIAQGEKILCVLL
jgi:deoxyribodipyrimidine photo-lyase